MRAFRKGLTAGLRESVDWATGAGAPASVSAGNAGSFSLLHDSGDAEGGAAAWEPDLAAPEEHCVVQILSAAGVDALAGDGVRVAVCASDARGNLKGRRSVTLPYENTARPVWNR